MTSEVTRAASDETDRRARIEKLEDDLRRIANDKRRLQREQRDLEQDRDSDSSEALVDVAIDLVRSAVDAQFEFVRAISRIFERSAAQAQSELRGEDDESADRGDRLSRIPSALSKAITRSFEDQGRAADEAVDRFTDSFRSNRTRSRAANRSDLDG